MQQASLGRHHWGGIMGEASGCIWEASGGIWETSGRHLGSIWRHLGGIWETWAPKVAPRWSEGYEAQKSVTPLS